MGRCSRLGDRRNNERRERVNDHILRATRYKRRANSERNYLRGSSCTSRRVRVPTMREGETMQETMEREKAEAIATLNRANRALSRIFGIEEGEGEDE